MDAADGGRRHVRRPWRYFLLAVGTIAALLAILYSALRASGYSVKLTRHFTLGAFTSKGNPVPGSLDCSEHGYALGYVIISTGPAGCW